MEQIILVPKATEYPADSLLFGERIRSVRALLQKPSKIGTAAFSFGTQFEAIPYLFQNPGTVIGPSNYYAPWTWVGYYKNLFTGLAASERIKIFPLYDCWLGASRFSVVSNLAVTSSVSTMAPITFCGANKGAEFNIPYYYNKKYYPCRINRDVTSVNGLPITKVVVDSHLLADPGDRNNTVTYYSLGPDIRATCFRQVPTVSLYPRPFRVPFFL